MITRRKNYLEVGTFVKHRTRPRSHCTVFIWHSQNPLRKGSNLHFLRNQLSLKVETIRNDSTTIIEQWWNDSEGRISYLGFATKTFHIHYISPYQVLLALLAYLPNKNNKRKKHLLNLRTTRPKKPFCVSYLLSRMPAIALLRTPVQYRGGCSIL